MNDGLSSAGLAGTLFSDCRTLHLTRSGWQERRQRVTLSPRERAKFFSLRPALAVKPTGKGGSLADALPGASRGKAGDVPVDGDSFNRRFDLTPHT